MELTESAAAIFSSIETRSRSSKVKLYQSINNNIISYPEQKRLQAYTAVVNIQVQMEVYNKYLAHCAHLLNISVQSENISAVFCFRQNELI